MKTYSLSQLATYIQRVVALNFREPVWVRAEILQSRTNRGQTYLELVQKKDHSNNILAQASAILWQKHRKTLTDKLSGELDQLLTVGTEVSLLVELNYHTVFGLKLFVKDLDPTYTLGRLQQLRQQTLARLRQEDLIDRNQQVPIAPVLQKIAIISAPTASGLQDFMMQLQGNEYGYQYDLKLFENAMQGNQVLPEFLQNLKMIFNDKRSYDCIVMIRGGGSKLDLHAFDHYEMAQGIANSPIPFFTGIGHDADVSVADMCANRAFKTPTAVAGFLIDRHRAFEQGVLNLYERIRNTVLDHLHTERYKLNRYNQSLRNVPSNIIQIQRQNLRQRMTSLTSMRNRLLQREWEILHRSHRLIRAYDPKQILARGYSYCSVDGQVIKSVHDINLGSELTTYLSDGSVVSEVLRSEKR